MPLLDELGGLKIKLTRSESLPSPAVERAIDSEAHSAYRLCHFQPAHHHAQTSPAERCHGELVLYITELRVGVHDAHVVQFGEDGGLHLGAEGVLGGE